MTRIDFEFATREPTPAPADSPSGPFRAFTQAFRQIRALSQGLQAPRQEDVFVALGTMRQSSQRAEDMRRPLVGNAAETDPTGWNYYLAQKAIADDDSSRAKQVATAYLRSIYGGDVQRSPLIEAAARDIAYQFRDDAQVQTIVTSALRSVRTETPAMRMTDQSLHTVGLAGAKLDELVETPAGQHNQAVDGFPDAEANLELCRQLLVNSLIAEFDETSEKIPRSVILQDLDPAGWIWEQIADRYRGDPELANAVVAARVIKEVVATPPELRLKAMGDLMPPSFDPSARAVVKANPQIVEIVDSYVNNSIHDVGEILRNDGPVAAARLLRQRADGDLSPGVTRDIAARIINGLVTTELPRMLVMATADERTTATSPTGPSQDQLSKFAIDLAATIDFVGADASPVSGQWRSDDVRMAVEGFARTIARNPNIRLHGFMLEDGVAAGYPTLALATADELRKLGPADTAPILTNGNSDRRLTADDILRAVSSGQKEFLGDCKATYDGAATHAAQFGNPSWRYDQVLTPDQLAGGREALRQANPGLVATMQGDRQAIDDRGYRILRMSESVEFYQPRLGTLPGYSAVESGRREMMGQEEIAPLVFLSDKATRRIGTQSANDALLGALSNTGAALPQTYGVRAQLIGDFAEFYAETYIVRGVNSGENMERHGPVPLAASPDDIKRINATRVGHLPFFAGPAIWGIGGAFQAALTGYLYDKVKFDPGQEWRKPILLGLVGGFAAFHLLEGAMAMARLRPHMFDTLPALRDAMKQHTPWVFCEPGSRRDIATRDVVEPTPRLITALVGLMVVATVWDTSGVVYNAGKDTVKTWTHGVNLFNDAVLLRLQVRELAKRLLHSPTLREGVYKSVLGSLSESKVVLNGIEAALRRIPVVGTNPIGWLVNIGYLSTTLINWGVDQDRAVAKSEAIERTFLQGAGMPAQSAGAMSEHNWWSGDPESAGLARVFRELGGDPAGFYQWLSTLGPTPEVMDAATEYTTYLDNGEARLNQGDQAYLALPEDPRALDVANYSYIGFNAGSDRWEDPTTRMYWETSTGLWRFDRRIGSQEAMTDPALDKDSYYDPKKRRLTYSSYNSKGILIQSATGLENWLHAHGAPLLPRPNPYAQASLRPAAKAPEIQASWEASPLNLYTVSPGDNLEKISNGDPLARKAIFELNPWLESKFPGQKTDRSKHGRDPDLLRPGERLILPQGYVVEN